jgi:hypothetical protein
MFLKATIKNKIEVLWFAYGSLMELDGPSIGAAEDKLMSTFILG